MATRVYQVLTQEEQDDMLMQTVHAQEASHFSHTVNVDRYTAMLPDMPEGPFKDRIAELLVTEQKAVEDHDHLLEKTVPQLPKGTALDEAKVRFAARQAAASLTRA